MFPTRPFVLTLASAFAIASCKSSCAEKTSSPLETGSTSPPPPIAPEDFPPAPSPWTFHPVRDVAELALPEGCTARAPAVSTRIGSPIRFAAEPRSLGHLVVREASGLPPRLTAAGILTLNPDGTSVTAVRIPWMSVGTFPRVARTKTGGFVAGIDHAEAVGQDYVSLWRGGSTEQLGVGDGFETIDLACGGERCALLTSRRAAHAVSGAEVWFGRPTDPATAWRSVSIEAGTQGVTIARVDDPASKASDGGAPSSSGGIVVTMKELRDVVFFSVDEPGGPREIARFPAPNGVLDAVAQSTPMALVYATAPDDEDGCAHEGGKIDLERAGLPTVPFHAPAPPLGGNLRRLAKGYLATWLAPLGCHASRYVVYAVVLDESGKPTSDVMAVGDVSTTTRNAVPTYAIAADGSDVDLWLEADGAVTWLRARCEPKSP